MQSVLYIYEGNKLGKIEVYLFTTNKEKNVHLRSLTLFILLFAINWCYTSGSVFMMMCKFGFPFRIEMNGQFKQNILKK